MKKYITIAFMALITSGMLSCKKDIDIAGTEAKLPAIQLTSLGYTQVSPFTITATTATPTTPATIATILQINFGATTTGKATGKFTLEFFDGTSIGSSSVPVKTVTFNSWIGKDDTSAGSTTNHTITYTLLPTTYKTTNLYGGSMAIKLGLLGLTANRTYSVRATAYTDGGQTSSLNQLSFFKTI